MPVMVEGSQVMFPCRQEGKVSPGERERMGGEEEEQWEELEHPWSRND